MKASIILADDDHVTITNSESSIKGWRMPYLCRNGGMPVFVLDTQEPWFVPGYDKMLDAFPGMVGIAQGTDDIYVIDADGIAQRMSLHVLSEREYTHYVHLKESLRAEAA
jgi:hypothetical protein